LQCLPLIGFTHCKEEEDESYHGLMQSTKGIGGGGEGTHMSMPSTI